MADTAKVDVFIEGVKDPSPDGRERLAQALVSHYGLAIEQARRVVAGGRFRVKRDVEVALGRRYVSHLEALGARTSLAEPGSRPTGPRAAVPGAAPATPRPAAGAAPPPAAAPAARVPAAPPATRAPAAPAAPRAAAPPPDDDGIAIGALELSSPDALAALVPPPAPAAPTRAAAPLERGLVSLDSGQGPDLALDTSTPGAVDPFQPPEAAAERGLELAGGAPARAPAAAAGEDPFQAPEGQVELALDLDTGSRPGAAPPAASRPATGFGLDEAPPPSHARIAVAPASPPAPAPAAPRVAPPAPAAAAPRPVAAPRQVAAPRPSPAAASATRAGTEPRLLFGGRLREKVAVRLLVGVLLCVGLSFAPASMYASHVDTTVVRPLQLEERELREKPPRADAVRSAAVIREEIGAARTKAFAVTLLIWLAASAGLSFVWFRVT